MRKYRTSQGFPTYSLKKYKGWLSSGYYENGQGAVSLLGQGFLMLEKGLDNL